MKIIKKNFIPEMIPTAFEMQGDEDWFKFSAVAGEVIRIDTMLANDYADTVLELYVEGEDMFNGQPSPPDSSSLVLLRDDDGAVYGLDSRLYFEAPYTALYYIKVKNYNSYQGGYVIALTRTGVIYSADQPELP